MNTSSIPATVARHLRPQCGGDTQTVLPTDWRLWACDQSSGREYIADWGPEEYMLTAMGHAAESNRDVWLIDPTGKKHLPFSTTLKKLETLRPSPRPAVRDYEIATVSNRPIFHYNIPWLECRILYAVQHFSEWLLVVGDPDNGSYDWVLIKDDTVTANSDSAFGVAAEALHAGMTHMLTHPL